MRIGYASGKRHGKRYHATGCYDTPIEGMASASTATAVLLLSDRKIARLMLRAIRLPLASREPERIPGSGTFQRAKFLVDDIWIGTQIEHRAIGQEV